MNLPDQSERERATGSLGETLIVEASAGTGKTTTMVARILALLTTTPAGGGRPPALTEIVAITFTDRAAQEMTDRLRVALFSGIAEAGWDETSMVRSERLAQALTELERAPIGTIHGLCSNILRRYPIEAGVDVQFRIMDSREAAEMQRSEWDEWITRELQRFDEGGLPPEDTAVLHAMDLGLTPDMLYDIARHLLEYRTRVRPDELAHSAAPFPQWADEIAALSRLIDRIEDDGEAFGMKRPSSSVIGQMRDWLADITSAHADGEDMDRLIVSTLPFSEKSGTAKPVVEAVGAVAEQVSRRTVGDVVRWLSRPADSPTGPGYVATHERAKHAAGALDFNDLLLRARDLVRNSPTARRRLRAEYRYLIVDEFQDTDAVQAELIVMLASGRDVDDGAGAAGDESLVPGKLCVVGDPKQSIYRFRGADIETYADVGRLVGENGRCRLSTNFRSHPEIISAANDVFSRAEAFGNEDPDRDIAFQPGYRAMEAGPGPWRTDRAHVRIVVPRDAGEVRNIGEGRPIEAGLVAAAAKAAIGEQWSVRDPDTGHERPVTYGDIAVLYRKSTILAPYLRALEQAGIPYHHLGGRTFFDREEVVRLISVLTAIEQPGDELQIVSALRSPFFGVSDADLARAALRGRFDYRETVPDEYPDSVRAAFECLDELHRTRRDKRPSELLMDLLNRTGALAVYAQTRTGERAVANLLKVVDEARHLESDGPVPFRRLQEHLRSLREDGSDEGEAAFDDPSGSRLRLLSMHKAKGLEFPVAILIDLAADRTAGGNVKTKFLAVRRDRPSGDPGVEPGSLGGRSAAADVGMEIRAGDVLLETPGWSRLEARNEERDAAESVRLLYVAMTRARDYLLLPRTTAAKSKSWQRLILSAPGVQDLMQWSPDANGAVASSEEEVLERPVAELADELRNLTDERHGWRESALTRRLNHKRPSDHDEERDRDDAGGSDDGAGRRGTEREQAMLMGTVVHSALEDLISGDDSDTIARTVLMHAEAKHLDKERRPQAERLVQQGLACGITKRAEEAEKCWREVSVREIDEGRPGGLTITSCICDLLFEDDGGFVLADYKTDDLAVADVDERVARYTPQLETYARALRISTGTLVREAWLLFLNTDGPPLEKKVDLGERTAPERDDEPRAGEGP